MVREMNLATITHGRVLVRDAESGGPFRLVVGFHGYAQSADEMFAELDEISGSTSWTVAAMQGLHRFYRRRTDTTVASWMTRQDRDVLIADNIGYVNAAITALAAGRPVDKLVLCGFSQGVAMAFRAGVRGLHGADAIVALGGDVPPELLADRSITFPRVILARGRDDAFLTKERLEQDAATLRDRGGHVEAIRFDGGHEWHDAVRIALAALLKELEGR
jgi:predicted esterase